MTVFAGMQGLRREDRLYASGAAMYFSDDILSTMIEEDIRAHFPTYLKCKDLLATCGNFRRNYDFFLELNALCETFSPHASAPIFDIATKYQADYAKLQRSLAALGGYSKGSYLDVGCGFGNAVRAAADLGFERCLGVDTADRYAAQWAKYAGEAPQARFVKAPLEAINEIFDVITSFAAFEHFAKPVQMLSTISRLLAPAGHFVAVFSPIYNCDDGMHLYRQVYIPWHQHLFDEDIIKRYMLEHGYENHYYLNYLNKYSALVFFLLFTNEKSMKLQKISSFYETKHLFFLVLVKQYISLSWEELLVRGFCVHYQK